MTQIIKMTIINTIIPQRTKELHYQLPKRIEEERSNAQGGEASGSKQEVVDISV